MNQREIIFSFDGDFADILESKGIDPDSVTSEEWRVFEQEFMSGISWHEVAEICADNLAYYREVNLSV